MGQSFKTAMNDMLSSIGTDNFAARLVEAQVERNALSADDDAVLAAAFDAWCLVPVNTAAHTNARSVIDAELAK